MKRRVILFLVILAALLPGAAWAHGGGTPRVTAQPAGDYLLYVWTEPAAPRAGTPLHVTVSVTLPDGSGGETPITDANVTVIFQPGRAGEAVVVEAAPGSAADGGFYEADTTLPAGGTWTVDVQVAGPQGSGGANFPVEVVGARSGSAWLLWAVLGLAVVAVAAVLWMRRAGRVPRRAAVA
jgi:hypothetical protein